MEIERQKRKAEAEHNKQEILQEIQRKKQELQNIEQTHRDRIIQQEDTAWDF